MCFVTLMFPATGRVTESIIVQLLFQTPTREKSAEDLSKMVMDKLVGPKVRICVTRFLPTIFLDAMKQSPEAAVSMLDSEHENPELIWNEDTRKKVERSNILR